MKKFALVLGGGAAKGYAHIGVLKVLEKHNLKPDLIVGTSMGALVGGMYASGRNTQELETLAMKLKKIGDFDLFSALFKGNLLNTKKVKNLITNELGDTLHEDCPIKFVAVATDIQAGKEEHFSSGSLRDSIMASISVPGMFPNYHLNGRRFCDGGLLNNLAEDVAREIMPDAIVISVDVIGEYSKQVERVKMKTIETFLNASTLMTTTIVKNKPLLADLRLVISQPEISQMDFSPENTPKAIHNGERVASRNIKKIKELLEEKIKERK